VDRLDWLHAASRQRDDRQRRESREKLRAGAADTEDKRGLRDDAA